VAVRCKDGLGFGKGAPQRPQPGSVCSDHQYHWAFHFSVRLDDRAGKGNEAAVRREGRVRADYPEGAFVPHQVFVPHHRLERTVNRVDGSDFSQTLGVGEGPDDREPWAVWGRCNRRSRADGQRN
jgi:hypothetical protein